MGRLYLGEPIPLPPEINDWSHVPILECGEPLADIGSLASAKVEVSPQYHKQGIPGALNRAACRVGVVQRLLHAAKLLPEDYSLLIFDAWRPLNVQRAIFHSYKERLGRENPGLDQEGLDRLTRTYVSYPSEDLRHPPIHSTGGALDLTIVDDKGIQLNMGTTFDEFSKRSATRFFEIKHLEGGELSAEERIALANRRLLFHVMTTAGFVNYPEEWWHFDFGDQLWGAITGQPACYGYIEL